MSDAAMSERLEALLQTMHFRNLRATMFYEDAAAENEFGHTTTPDDAYDWQTRRFIESGLCWRDTAAGGRSTRFSTWGSLAA